MESSKLKEGLPHKCLVVCTFAFTQLEETSHQLKNGSIKISDLKMIDKNLQQMKRLLKSATVQHKDEGSSVDKEVLDQRIEELSYFKKQLRSLHHLCKNLSSTIQGKV